MGTSLGCSDTLWPPTACTFSMVPSAASTVTSQPTTEAPSRANIRAGARPFLPPVPVMTQTFPASRPDISVHALSCCSELLRLRDAHLIGELRNLAEVPMDHIEGRRGERTCPVAEELGGHGEGRGRNRARMRQPFDARPVSDLGPSADSVGDVQHVVPVLQRLNGCE